MKQAGVLFAVLLLAAPASGAVPTDYWRPTLAEVARLETRLALPAKAAPLARYTRYYTGAPPKGSHRITGLLYRDVDGTAGVRIVEKPGDWPKVSDGGCDVIEVTYSLATDEILQMACNGVA